jgi:DNA polymerase type B, organellar and viral.
MTMITNSSSVPYFLKKKDRIELPPMDVINASLLSYHGGKNGLYVDGGFYENVSEIDLNSAYPYAMKCLPSFLKGEYRQVNKYMGNKYVGIYCVSGKLKCPYNIFFNHEFKPIENGDVRDIWITSYELEEALKYKEFDMVKCFGYIWIPDDDRNPLGEYVDYFYKKKQETPKTNSMYHFYKLALNSLYGKGIL